MNEREMSYSEPNELRTLRSKYNDLNMRNTINQEVKIRHKSIARHQNSGTFYVWFKSDAGTNQPVGYYDTVDEAYEAYDAFVVNIEGNE